MLKATLGQNGEWLQQIGATKKTCGIGNTDEQTGAIIKS
jgi:hypothetical protein